MVVLRTGRGLRGVPMGVYGPARSGHTWIGIDAIPMSNLGDPRPRGAFTTFDEIPAPEGRARTVRLRPLAS